MLMRLELVLGRLDDAGRVATAGESSAVLERLGAVEAADLSRLLHTAG
jgi:hypothetical protein